MINIKKIAIIIKNLAFEHKIISALIILCLLGVGFWGYKNLTATSGETRYVLASATKGTIISSVSGTGQVSASGEINLSPGSGASGKIVYLNAVSGQKVSAGTLLLKLDTTSAEKAIRDAQSNLVSAQIALERLSGTSTLIVPLNKQNAIDALNHDYESGYNTVSDAFIDLPTIMADLQTIIYGDDFNSTQANIDFYTNNSYIFDQNATVYKDSLIKSYKKASDEYTKNFNDYKATTRYSDNATIDTLITETYATMKDVSQAIKDTNNLIQFYIDTLSKQNIEENSKSDTQLSTVNADGSKADSDIISLLNIQSTIKSDKTAVSNADLDVSSQELSVTKAKNALSDAKENLANYYIYAPFGGIIGAVSVQKGESISSGTSAITFITQKDTTQISLSETDIPKIKLGNKAILTFDAIDGLSITGQVSEIDTIGTVSQGVVSYNVKITFDTQDERVKPGMSVNANIITQTKQNVLLIPNSAVKSKNGEYYVLVLSQKQDLSSSSASQGFISASAPVQKNVEIGIADDMNTEITSGLSEGDQVVSRTISGSASASSAAPASSSANKTNSRTGTFFIGGGAPPAGR